MTGADLIRDLKAATLAHIGYERMADELARGAVDLVGTEWAAEVAAKANVAQRASFAEMSDPEPPDLPDEYQRDREEAIRQAQVILREAP